MNSYHSPHPTKGATSQQHPASAPVPASPKRRIVNLLIQDRRRGDESPFEYAEIRIPLRPADEDEGQGYWADAKDVAEALQASPGRIDGEQDQVAMKKRGN
jgi:hypothetical protein